MSKFFIFIYSSSSQLYVKAIRNLLSGYTHTVCLECSSPYQTVQKDGWVISLAGCSNSMTVPSASPTAVTISYTSSTSDDEYTIQKDWDTIF